MLKAVTPYIAHAALKMALNTKLQSLLKKDLLHHNKEYHSKPDPLKDQPWMLLWTDGGASLSVKSQLFLFLL